MSASPAQDDIGERRLVHTREVVCKGYARADGLFDVEGRMVDLTADGTGLVFHELAAGEAIHDLRLVLTIDADLLIHRAQAFMVSIATPYCSGAAAAYGQLAGLRIGPGFRQAAKARVGTVTACTHLTELLGPMATTAMQTLMSEKRAAKRRGDLPQQDPMPRPEIVGSCHAYRIESPATAVIWPPERRAAAA